MEALLALLLILGLLNESETPVWSEEPTECKEITFEEKFKTECYVYINLLIK